MENTILDDFDKACAFEVTLVQKFPYLKNITEKSLQALISCIFGASQPMTRTEFSEYMGKIRRLESDTDTVNYVKKRFHVWPFHQDEEEVKEN